MKRYFLLTIIAVGILAACTDRDDDVTTVNIRIQNNTSSVFSEVRIVGKDTVYEAIPAGDYSEYLEYEEAFREMALTVVADSIDFNYTPASEFTAPLPIGFYTYELSFGDTDQLELNFKVD